MTSESTDDEDDSGNELVEMDESILNAKLMKLYHPLNQ